MSTPLIIYALKPIEKSHGVSLNQWIGGLIYITVQTWYDLQNLIMHLIRYTNATTEP